MKYMIADEWNLLKENFSGVSGKTVLEFYDSIHSAITKLCLSKEVNIQNQFCISTANVLFHKYILNYEFCIDKSNLIKETLLSLSEMDSYSNEVNEEKLPKIKSIEDIYNIEKVSDVEVTYLACFFLATKICNSLVSINRISSYYLNSVIEPIAKSFSNLAKLDNNSEEHQNSSRKNSLSKIKDTVNKIQINNLNNFSLSYIERMNRFGKNDTNSLELVKEALKKNLEEKIKLKELDILNIIGFDINIDLPYIYVEKMKPYFLQYIPQGSKHLEIIYNFVNDSFKVPVILYYSPLKIALACIYLVHHHFKVDLIELKNKIKWYQIIDKDIELQEIKDIALIINGIYQLNKENRKKNPCELLEKTLFVISQVKSIPIEKNKCVSFLCKKRIEKLDEATHSNITSRTNLENCLTREYFAIESNIFKNRF